MSSPSDNIMVYEYSFLLKRTREKGLRLWRSKWKGPQILSLPPQKKDKTTQLSKTIWGFEKIDQMQIDQMQNWPKQIVSIYLWKTASPSVKNNSVYSVAWN